MAFRSERRHLYYTFITCPSCGKDFSYRTVSPVFIPLPIFLRQNRYYGPCRECRLKKIKNVLTQWKEQAKGIENDKASGETTPTKEEEEL